MNKITIQTSIKENSEGVVNDKGVITFSFGDKDSGKKVLQLNVGGVNEKYAEELRWIIADEDGRVDEYDYTGGLLAEIQMTRYFAGPLEAPKNYKVSLIYEGILQSGINLFVKSKSVITKAQWQNSIGAPISNASPKDQVHIYFEGYGINGTNFFIDVYVKGDKGENKLIKNFSKKITPQFDYFESFSLPLSAPNFSMNYYFILGYNHKGKKVVLFDGEKENVLLNVSIFVPTLSPPTSTSLAMVYGGEEYFTQKYEPCKFTAIKCSYDSGEKRHYFRKSKLEK